MIETTPEMYKQEQKPMVILKKAREQARGEIVPAEEAANALDIRYQGLDPVITAALSTMEKEGGEVIVNELLSIFRMTDHYHHYHPKYEEVREEQFYALAKCIKQIAWDIATLEIQLAIILIYINKENLLAYSNIHNMKEWLVTQCKVHPDTANHAIEFANRWPQLHRLHFDLFDVTKAMADDGLSMPKVNQLKSLERKEEDAYKQALVTVLEERGYIEDEQQMDEDEIEEGIFTDEHESSARPASPQPFSILEKIAPQEREKIEQEANEKAIQKLRQQAIEILTPPTHETIKTLEKKYKGGEQKPAIFYMNVDKMIEEHGIVTLKGSFDVQIGLSQLALLEKNKLDPLIKMPESGIQTGYKRPKEVAEVLAGSVTEDLYVLDFTPEYEGGNGEPEEEEESQGYVPPLPRRF
jgi:hypothetical protein